MSFVTTQPETLSAAAGDLQGIGGDAAAGNAAAASPTTAVIPAAADDVSALSTSAGSYAVTEAASTVAAG